MEWIKRNLLFVIGSLLSIGLMVLAAMYLMSGMRKNDVALEKLNAEYEQLKRLNSQSPHPGDEQTDNIAAAKSQRQDVVQEIDKADELFRSIQPIPAETNLNSARFAGALKKTIDQLQNNAARGGVELPTNYYFSFTAVQNRIQFDRAGLQPLAAQLGDVKAICSVLLDARVNALDSVQREKVSSHDFEAQQTTDYLTESSVTNEIGVLVPYEVTFRCFSSELAAVLSGYASSPYGLIVRAMNVEPVAQRGTGFGDADTMGGFAPAIAPRYVTPQPATPPPVDPPTGYGGGGGGYGQFTGGGGGGGYGQFMGGAKTPAYPAPTTPTYVAPTRTPVRRGGLPTVLDEKQFKVTMLVQVVRLTPNKDSNPTE